MRRYLHDLHLGRIDPRALGFPSARSGAAAPDFAALLSAGATAGRLPEAVAELRPRLGQYGKLREALARYRVLAADGSLVHPPFAAAAKRGETYRDGVALHRLLVVLGPCRPGGVVADAAGAHRQCGIAQRGQRHIGAITR